ncbi:MAG: hypothetical protein U9N61_10970 [Euryarchaeota archaeon]|nr:hypothetical protein [Euryarchaeota archaeon]
MKWQTTKRNREGHGNLQGDWLGRAGEPALPFLGVNNVSTFKKRLEASLANADSAVDNVEAGVLGILEQLEGVLEEGIAFRLEIAGKKIPVKLIMEPDELDGPSAFNSSTDEG